MIGEFYAQVLSVRLCRKLETQERFLKTSVPPLSPFADIPKGLWMLLFLSFSSPRKTVEEGEKYISCHTWNDPLRQEPLRDLPPPKKNQVVFLCRYTWNDCAVFEKERNVALFCHVDFFLGGEGVSRQWATTVAAFSHTCCVFCSLDSSFRMGGRVSRGMGLLVENLDVCRRKILPKNSSPKLLYLHYYAGRGFGCISILIASC